MPRGKYDRSKIKKKSNKSDVLYTSPDTKVETSNRDERLSHLERCASILQNLSGVNTQVAYEARVYIAKAVHEIVSSMLTTGPVTVAESAPVEQLSAISSSAVRLKKDGTPRLRPGPKPKMQTGTVETSAATSQSSSNGTTSGKVFNPEHAGQ